MFEENFEKKYSHLPESVKAAGPHAQVSAEARHRGRGLLGSATSVASRLQNHHKGGTFVVVLLVWMTRVTIRLTYRPFSGWGQRKRSCGGTVGL